VGYTVVVVEGGDRPGTRVDSEHRSRVRVQVTWAPSGIVILATSTSEASLTWCTCVRPSSDLTLNCAATSSTNAPRASGSTVGWAWSAAEASTPTPRPTMAINETRSSRFVLMILSFLWVAHGRSTPQRCVADAMSPAFPERSSNRSRAHPGHMPRR
jgi:hypothetical protein